MNLYTIGHSTRTLEEFLEKLHKLADNIEPYLNKTIRKNFREISAAIKEFDPLIEGKDFRILKKFYSE